MYFTEKQYINYIKEDIPRGQSGCFDLMFMEISINYCSKTHGSIDKNGKIIIGGLCDILKRKKKD